MGMVCGRCGESSRDGARFCGSCGERLNPRCATCDAELSPGVRFCEACGAPVAAPVGAAEPAEQARKTVTVVFADMVGSTSLQEHMDPESVRAFNAHAYAAMRAAIERHGGHVVKFVGDGMMAVFGVPELREDDAIRALAAAADLRDERDGLRIGVNTGEVVVDDGDDDVVGDAVNVAARLETAAPVGGVLVGAETYRLTRDHATFGEPRELHVKGRQEPVSARLLLGIGPVGDDRTAAFVGRDTELARLVGAIGVVEATGRAQLVAVLGSPGVGKSRLLAELDAAVRDAATVLTGRCDASGGPTFAPMADVVRGAIQVAGGVDDDVADAVAFLLGEGAPSTPERTFWGIRRLVESAARVRPVLVLLDDAHWAEPMLLDLVEHLAEWLGECPVLLVVAGRPELRELRPSLVEIGGRASAVLLLEGLDADATRRLAAELLGSGGLPPALAARVVGATEGNPLFVRELVRMLVDDGVLRATGDGWMLTVAADEIEVPPTITSLLAARVERLRADERTVLERASVLGHDVVRGAVAHLLPEASRAHLDAALESLRRKELLEPAGSYWIDEPLLRFHHALIRDAAYRRVLKASRAELHERAARWFLDKTGGGPDYDELIGFHLEQALAHRRELGQLDDGGRALATEAARRLGDAARRALHGDDLAAAGALAGRALACLDTGDEARADVLLVRCEALLGTGDVAAARAAVDELSSTAGGDERLVAWAAAFSVQLATLTGAADLVACEVLAQQAADALAALGDAAGAAKANRARASVLARLGRVADTEAALDRALTAAREAGDHRQVNGVLAAAPLAALWGPSPVPRAGGRCLDLVRLLRITTGARGVEAVSTRCQAVLEAFRGRHDAARSMLASARQTLEDLGLRHGLLELELYAGIVELTAGDPVAAEYFLRTAHEGLAALGIDVDAAQAAAHEARAVLALGDLDRALSLAETADRLGGRDLKTAIVWRTVKAEILARRGDHGAAVALAQAAVALAEPTDALVDTADAYAALGAVLALTGDDVAARVASEQARTLYDRKGATALAARLTPAPRGSASAADDPATIVVADNAAVRAFRRSFDCILRRDWDALRTTITDDFSSDDHRVGMRARFDRESFIASFASLDAAPTEVRVEPVDVRGEHLALARVHIGSGSVEGFDFEVLCAMEIDERGLVAHTTLFDEDAVDAARAELDGLAADDAEVDDADIVAEALAVHADSQALRLAADFEQGFNACDWDHVERVLAPDVVYLDHRPLSFAETHGIDDTLARLRLIHDVLPGASTRTLRIVTVEREVVVAHVAIGTSDRRTEFLILFQSGGGRIQRHELFAVADEDAARRRAAELSHAGAPADRDAR